jgi:hypothetical protein
VLIVAETSVRLKEALGRFVVFDISQCITTKTNKQLRRKKRTEMDDEFFTE